MKPILIAKKTGGTTSGVYDSAWLFRWPWVQLQRSLASQQLLREVIQEVRSAVRHSHVHHVRDRSLWTGVDFNRDVVGLGCEVHGPGDVVEDAGGADGEDSAEAKLALLRECSELLHVERLPEEDHLRPQQPRTHRAFGPDSAGLAFLVVRQPRVVRHRILPGAASACDAVDVTVDVDDVLRLGPVVQTVDILCEHPHLECTLQRADRMVPFVWFGVAARLLNLCNVLPANLWAIVEHSAADRFFNGAAVLSDPLVV
mmetsp:Transcript_42649/g.100203  ORF Transcript_42649/g.100203 Transcript_42649/m.100203 type:complete len:257 (-) Transcript_42649:335-1105(-)